MITIMNYQLLIFTLLVALISPPACFGATRTVKKGANLGYEIGKAKPGDTLLVEAGTYDSIRLDGKQGSATKPIIVKAKGNGAVVIDGKKKKTAFALLNSKYLAFEGLTFKNGNFNGVYVQNSEYIVFVNNRIQSTYGAGLKISGLYAKGGTKSHHVDWIGGEIQNTGTGLGGAYGESIYIGQAQQALDYTHNIWIEGVKITGNPGAEGIDLKGEVYNVTLLNNEIYNIQPGLHRKERGDSVTQTNDSAIQVAAGRGKLGYTDRFSNVWVVGNKIRNIGSNDPVRGNGIVIYNNPGAIVFGNEIDNVIGSGIRAFTCCDTGDLDYMAYVFENKISNTKRAALDLYNGESRVCTKKSDVPNSIWNKRPKRQTWYESGSVAE